MPRDTTRTAIAPTRRAVIAGAGAVSAGLMTQGAFAEGPGDKIRPLTILAKPQASDPSQYQAAELMAQAWRKLGLKVNIQVVARAQLTEIVWMNRTKWGMTMWEMVGRPERSDPDEFIYSLFHSSLAPTGYDFGGYINLDYDKLAEAQRAETDRDKRRAIVQEAQRLITRDQPHLYLVYPRRVAAFNTDVWDPATIVEETGIGIRNFWTFIRAVPKGNQHDMVLNCNDPVGSVKPLRMDPIGSWATDLVWDKLMRVGLDGEPVPWAAESVKWAGPTTVDVVMRDGMQFHDGSPVTVEDVKYSFDLPAIGGKSPQFLPFVSNISSVTITGPRALRFELKSAQSSFLTSSLTKINIIPKKVWQSLLESVTGKPQLLEDVQEEHPIGSGPFKFVSWRAQEELVLERFAGHWSPPKMARWIIRVVPNQEATLGMLRNGELNFLAIFTGDPENIANLGKDMSNLKVVATTDIGFQFLAWNLRRPPFNDTAFRRALSTAISRQIMAGAVWNGYAEPAGSCISTALPFWHADDSLLAGGDMNQAKKMLETAGYTVSGGELHYPAGKKEELASN